VWNKLKVHWHTCSNNSWTDGYKIQYMVFQKSSPPPLKTYRNIFTSVKSFCVKFCNFVDNSCPHVSTNVCRFILIFHQMALIFPRVPMVFVLSSFEYSPIKWKYSVPAFPKWRHFLSSRVSVSANCKQSITVWFLSASLYVSKRGAYWDRLCRDVVGRWLVGCHARALWPNGAS